MTSVFIARHLVWEKQTKRMKIRHKKSLCMVVGVLLLVVGSFLLQLCYYLLSEFVFCTHRQGQTIQHIGVKDPNGTIPLYIHQIFFFITQKELPKTYRQNQESWEKHNPIFKYKLWNATMIDKLIEDKYPYLRDLYHSYGHWIRRSDVARYLVLHQYGGIYVDMDLQCLNPVSHLLKRIGYKGIVMYETTPFGVTNDFLVTEAQHPFFAYVIKGLYNSNRWYVFPHAQTMLSTGPTYLTGRYYNFDRKEDIHILPRANMSEFFSRTPGFSWHNWDSATIKWYNDNYLITVPLTKILVTIAAVIFGVLLLRTVIKYFLFSQISCRRIYGFLQWGRKIQEK